jgi:hypothetical protein
MYNSPTEWLQYIVDINGKQDRGGYYYDIDIILLSIKIG